MRAVLGRSVRALGALSLALGLTVLIVVPATGEAASAADDPSTDGLNLSVTVGPGTAVPSPSSSPGPSGTNRTTTTTVGGSTVVTGSSTAPPLGDDEYSVGGVLYVSGLRTEYRPSINPLAGELRAHFTVRNVSTAIIDSSSRFWVTSPVGTEISSVEDVPIAGLKPNESVVVDATLTGVGQWTFATAHVTLTPPDVVDGVPLEPLTRDVFVVLPPWFLLALAAIVVLASVAVRIVRSQRAGSIALVAAAEPVA
jgi:hypothetical protein